MADDAQKCGYLEIKQSSRVKGRKLKTWRKRWVVVTKMSDLAAGTFAAKVDVYADETAWRQGRSNRMTFVLEHVTAVQLASSKTHPFAFEIVEAEPVLVLSGASEMESYHWMSALRHIFFNEDKDSDSDSYLVSIQPCADSQRLGLEGQYVMRISADSITLCTTSASNTFDNPSEPSDTSHTLTHSAQASSRSLDSRKSSVASHMENAGEGSPEDTRGTEVVCWRLAMLKRFNVEKEPYAGQPWIFLLECGPNSPTGEATFRFLSQKAQQILKSVRRCISIAMATRQRANRQSVESRNRSESILTVTGYQHVLDRSERGTSSIDGKDGPASGTVEEPQDVERTRSVRSGSGSSISTLEYIPSPTFSTADLDFGMTTVMDAHDLGNSLPKIPPRSHRVSVASLPGSFSNPLTDLFGSGFQYQQELNVQQWQQQQQILLWQQQQQQNSLQQPPGPQQWLQQQQQQMQQLMQEQKAQNPQLFGVASIPRNSSVPNVGVMATEDKGYAIIGNGDVVRMRTLSMTTERPRTSASVCSGDSGVVVTDAGTVGVDSSRPTPSGGQRVGSNSFDSAVSVESSSRRISDAGEQSQDSQRPLPPEPPSVPREGKISQESSSSNIYQDIDSIARAHRRTSVSGPAMGPRRHSTGDVRKENDYEELEALRGVVAPAASVLAVSDTPPELPARPAALLAQKKSKSLHGSRVWSGFSIFGQRTPTRSRQPSGDSFIRDGALSRSSSSDVYSTITDEDGDSRLLYRRQSSDVTPISSRLDLLQPEPPTQKLTPPLPAEDARQSRTFNSSKTFPQFQLAGATDVGKEDSHYTSMTRNLLNFSDSDLSIHSQSSSRKDLSDTKAALMDFFLNDTTFHSNPMVTGQLKPEAKFTSGVSISVAHAQPRNLAASQASNVKSQQPPVPAGWVQFSDDFPPPAKNPNPWKMSTSTNQPGRIFFPDTFTQPVGQGSGPVGGARSSTGITARVEGVYIDMRRSAGDEDEGAHGGEEYLCPRDVTKENAFPNFLW